MNRILIFWSCLIVLTSCAKAKDNTVVIEYSNKINGYKVKSTWKPQIVRYNHVIGPAIIEFCDEQDILIFTVVNNNFSVLKRKLPFSYDKDSLKIEDIRENLISLIYKEPKLNDEKRFGTTDEPFFFEDIDFDNEKELLIAEVDNGQRGVATFKAYKQGDRTQNQSNDITDRDPFLSLDEMTKIDYENRNIILYGSGGYCYDHYRIYSKKSSYGFEFIGEIVEERDDSLNKCYELKYKIIGESRELLTKREMGE